MTTSLVIAEKPSVGRDLARVLRGPFKNHEGYLESAEHVVTWAVGHLVQLAEPDEYDPKYGAVPRSIPPPNYSRSPRSSICATRSGRERAASKPTRAHRSGQRDPIE